jgi:hypothetical protein
MPLWLFLSFCGPALMAAVAHAGFPVVFSHELVAAWKQAALN